MAGGYAIGKVIGTIAGATFGEYNGNKFFKKEYSLIQEFDKLVKEQLSGLFLEFLRWII